MVTTVRYVMGLSWQQGPLARGSVGRFLTPEPLPERILFAEAARRRMRVLFADAWVADSEDVVLLHEPGHYPVAYFPLGDILSDVLVEEGRSTQHRDLGDTGWFNVTLGDHTARRAAWRHTGVPEYAADLRDRVAFAWRAMDAFYEEDERILGHAADPYHRVDIRQTSRHLVVHDEQVDGAVIADTLRPVVLYESGFAPRWYVPREDIISEALIRTDTQTFCPYKGVASYYRIADRLDAAWSYTTPLPEAARIADLVSFEPNRVSVHIDGRRLTAEPGQVVIAHGIDRGLDLAELTEHRS
jgi:uncharacterized protein (DUF427 family)